MTSARIYFDSDAIALASGPIISPQFALPKVAKNIKTLQTNVNYNRVLSYLNVAGKLSKVRYSLLYSGP